MKISGNEVKPGMLLEHKDDLWEVLKTQHVKPGKGGAFNQVQMKSVNKGTKLNERFRSSDTVEKASLEEINFNYLYEDEIKYYFINQKSFEQISLKKEVVGQKGRFLKEELEVKISLYEDKPISVDLPKQITKTFSGILKYSIVIAKAKEFGGIIHSVPVLDTKLFFLKFFGSTTAESTSVKILNSLETLAS